MNAARAHRFTSRIAILLVVALATVFLFSKPVRDDCFYRLLPLSTATASRQLTARL